MNIWQKTDILVVNEVEAAFYCKTEIDSLDKAKEEIKKTAEKYGNNVIFTLGKVERLYTKNG